MTFRSSTRTSWLALSLLIGSLAGATLATHALESTGIRSSSTLPTTCAPGDAYVITSGLVGVYICTATNTWTSPGPPAGTIVLIDTGTCPSGYTEETALNGQLMVGTLAANANVGTTGGANSITPAGTNSAPTFTGSALATHQHEEPFQIVSSTSMRMIAGTTFGTGTSRAAIGGWAPTAATTSAAVSLTQAVSAGTPAGTVTAPTFTGTAFDPHPAFTRVIACKKS